MSEEVFIVFLPKPCLAASLFLIKNNIYNHFIHPMCDSIKETNYTYLDTVQLLSVLRQHYTCFLSQQ